MSKSSLLEHKIDPQEMCLKISSTKIKGAFCFADNQSVTLAFYMDINITLSTKLREVATSSNMQLLSFRNSAQIITCFNYRHLNLISALYSLLHCRANELGMTNEPHILSCRYTYQQGNVGTILLCNRLVSDALRCMAPITQSIRLVICKMSNLATVKHN